MSRRWITDSRGAPIKARCARCQSSMSADNITQCATRCYGAQWCRRASNTVTIARVMRGTRSTQYVTQELRRRAATRAAQLLPRVRARAAFARVTRSTILRTAREYAARRVLRMPPRRRGVMRAFVDAQKMTNARLSAMARMLPTARFTACCSLMRDI